MGKGPVSAMREILITRLFLETRPNKFDRIRRLIGAQAAVSFPRVREHQDLQSDCMVLDPE